MAWISVFRHNCTKTRVTRRFGCAHARNVRNVHNVHRLLLLPTPLSTHHAELIRLMTFDHPILAPGPDPCHHPAWNQADGAPGIARSFRCGILLVSTKRSPPVTPNSSQSVQGAPP